MTGLRRVPGLFGLFGLAFVLAGATETNAQTSQLPASAAPQAAGARLLAAYPDHLARVEDGVLVWRDGTRMPLDDGGLPKAAEAWLARPGLTDMFRYRYPTAAPLQAPAAGADPGRARNAAFFAKMYGDCRKGEVNGHLVDVAWLPSRTAMKLKVTRINGVAAKLAAVSAVLDTLPATFDAYLLPPAGTYNCRTIAGIAQASAHSYGIAVDIALKPAHYWRWPKPASGGPVWRNAIPEEIVRIFERHGFIWGGRWHHYDTMHFEYRPELLAP